MDMVNIKRGESLTSSFLLVSAFLMQMLTGVVGITVPIYAAELGASPILLGFIGATGGLIYSFMPLVSGILSDRFRRKTFVFTSTFLYGLSCIFYSMVENPYMFIPIKALEWVSVAVFWPSVEALLTETSEVNIEEILRRFNLSWGSATIIGPMIGGSLISTIGIKTPFAVSSVISIALAFLAIMMIKEQLGSKPVKEREISTSSGNRSVSIVGAVIEILLFSTIGGVIFNIFPAYAVGLGIPAYTVGLIMLINGLFRLIAFLETYKIEAKFGRYFMFLTGSLIMALASALTAIGSTALVFAISFAFFGFGAGVLYASSIATLLKDWGSKKGYASGLFESLIGVGYFLGSLTGGFVSEYAPNAPYILGLFISLTVSVFQALYKK
ncbi:MFS transporter [Candidatus Bathyarchaeota archaeon]|nr:MFS transporter [Candidatus Bathyarchaeota archaeon]